MKNIIASLVVGIIIFSCRSTPKVEIEETPEKEQEVVTQTQDTVSNEPTPVDTVQNHPDTTKVEPKEKEEKKKIEKEKKDEKKEIVKEEEEPEVPETDVYNPHEDPTPNEFVLVDREAKPQNLDKIIAEIREDAKNKGVRGTVVVGILVSTHGNYLKHFYFGVTNKALEFIVSDKIQKLKFRPALRGSEPVKMWYKTEIYVP